jgi:hypothetical protein
MHWTGKIVPALVLAGGYVYLSKSILKSNKHKFVAPMMFALVIGSDWYDT